MRVYFDSSALVKRGITETHSEELREAIAQLGAGENALMSSTLAWIEVSRTVRSVLEGEDPAHVVAVIESSLSGIQEAPIARPVASMARRIGSPAMRSLDAIHLATAAALDADVFIAYDRRLLVVAEEMGFHTFSPGVPD